MADGLTHSGDLSQELTRRAIGPVRPAARETSASARSHGFVDRVAIRVDDRHQLIPRLDLTSWTAPRSPPTGR
ncbi:hypothetical protein [Streptomyces sp. NPDC059991]|uniref:hypothetical protein n=1 Tax=unclassified Streptomyces TaxID=2593676 RepID=UPI0036B0E6FF